MFDPRGEHVLQVRSRISGQGLRVHGGVVVRFIPSLKSFAVLVRELRTCLPVLCCRSYSCSSIGDGRCSNDAASDEAQEEKP